MSRKKTNYCDHICGECRLYVPAHSAVMPEWMVGRYNTGYCKPWKNGAVAMSVQRETQACVNFRKRRKSPVGKKTCACRECQYNNPTPDGHFCALLKDYMAPARCVCFKAKDYDHSDAMPERFREKWDEMNAR